MLLMNVAKTMVSKYYPLQDLPQPFHEEAKRKIFTVAICIISIRAFSSLFIIVASAFALATTIIIIINATKIIASKVL